MKINMESLIKKLFVLIVITICITCCKSYSIESAPYIASGEFVMDEESTDYSICGVNVLVLNKSEKNIREMNLVFFLFDRDGEPAEECRSMLSFEIEKNIGGMQEGSFCVSLDKYLTAVPEDKLLVDYLYLSKIIYEDGFVWEDPFGLVAFR